MSQRHMWEEIRVGEDVVFVYVTTPIRGVVGYGVVREKKIDSSFDWPEEHADKESIWPLRLKLSAIRMNPASHWASHNVTTPELSKRVRSGFQRIDPNLARELMENLKTSGGAGIVV